MLFNSNQKLRMPPLAAIALTCCFAHSEAMATAQSPDKILIDGKEHSLHTEPLGPYLAAHPGSIPIDVVIMSSNWRGYIATWAIDGDQLLLRTIDVLFPDKDDASNRSSFGSRRDLLPSLFPGAKQVLAEW